MLFLWKREWQWRDAIATMTKAAAALVITGGGALRRVLAATAIISISIFALPAQSVSNKDQSWTMEFPLEQDELASTGRNPYFILEPGYILVLEEGTEQLTIMDRAEIVSISEVLTTPAGKFSNTLKTAETSPLEPRALEYKYYARGVGLLQDGSLKLVRYGKTKVPGGSGRRQEQDDSR